MIKVSTHCTYWRVPVCVLFSPLLTLFFHVIFLSPSLSLSFFLSFSSLSLFHTHTQTHNLPIDLSPSLSITLSHFSETPSLSHSFHPYRSCTSPSCCSHSSGYCAHHKRYVHVHVCNVFYVSYMGVSSFIS